MFFSGQKSFSGDCIVYFDCVLCILIDIETVFSTKINSIIPIGIKTWNV